MNEENSSEIRNKLTAPKLALEKIIKGENVPDEFLKLALEDLKSITNLLQANQPK
jgi:hypothetical protein